jgi:hypothetical protein
MLIQEVNQQQRNNQWYDKNFILINIKNYRDQIPDQQQCCDYVTEPVNQLKDDWISKNLCFVYIFIHTEENS